MMVTVPRLSDAAGVDQVLASRLERNDSGGQVQVSKSPAVVGNQTQSVGMAHEGEFLIQARKDVHQLLIRNLEEIPGSRIGRDPMNEETLVHAQRWLQGLEIVEALGRKKLPVDFERSSGRVVKPGKEGRIDQAQFVITQNRRDLALPNELQHFFGIGSVANIVAQGDDDVHVHPFDVGKHLLKSGEIAVNVRDNGDAHRFLSPSAMLS